MLDKGGVNAESLQFIFELRENILGCVGKDREYKHLTVVGIFWSILDIFAQKTAQDI
jgi:hypothetical protein